VVLRNGLVLGFIVFFSHVEVHILSFWERGMFFLEEVDTWQWVERSSLEHPWFFSYLCQFFTSVTLFF
jgi:hypothetical protein